MEKTAEQIASDMAEAVATVIATVDLDKSYVAECVNSHGSSAMFVVKLREGVESTATHPGNGPWGVGMRAIRAARLHVVQENHTENGHFFEVVMGKAVSGIVTRVVVDGDRLHIVMKPDEDDLNDLTFKANRNDIHTVPLNGLRTDRLSAILTAVGDTVTIVHPDNKGWESPVMVNGRTSRLRRFERD